ncbi:MAG: outer membrane protein assembly factor BamD [Rubrivivax sp.]|jgi:outer membrane protein assembly factor BamD
MPNSARLFARPLCLLTCILSLAVLGACGNTNVANANDPNRLYAEAQQELESGAYDRAIKGFERVEAAASGTLLGQQALLQLAYAQWKSGERTTSLATTDRFLRLHPSSPAYDYGLYLRGLINFNDNLGLFGNLAGQRLAERDQRASREAHQSFKQLVDQFPDSKYTADARVRMDYIVNMLAEHEVQVARYYYRRGAYLAAANRAKQSLTEFPQTPSTADALVLMVLSYERLGLKELRDDAQRVLAKNFPQRQLGLDTPKRPWWQLW